MTSQTAPANPHRPPRTTATSATHGAALTFETIFDLDTAETPLRVKPLEETLLRVIHGVVRLVAGDDEQILVAGDEAIVPAGTPHRLSALGGEARFLVGLRSA